MRCATGRRESWSIRPTPWRSRRGSAGCLRTPRRAGGWATRAAARSRPTTTGTAWPRTSSGSTASFGGGRHRARADGVGGTVADELAVDGGPLLLGPRDDRFPLGVEHEHPRGRLEQAGAAADAPLPLDPHHDPPLRVDPDISRLGPLLGTVEGGARRAVAFLDHLAQMVEREQRDVLDAGMHVVDGRRGPRVHPQLEQRLHGDLGGAREHRGEPLLLHVRAERVRRRDIDREHDVGAEHERRPDGEIVHCGAVHVDAAADLARRQEPGQRARRKHGVLHRHVVQALEAPEHLAPRIDVHRVDDQGIVQLLEGEIADQPLDQGVERLAAEQGGGAHPLERHVGVGDGEDVLAAQVDRDLAQLGDAVARRPRRADQRAHARADDLGRQQAALGESLEHADVREALHAAAAEDETEACAAVHETAACPEGERSSNVVVAPMPALLIRRRVVRSRWTMAGLAVVVTLGLVALAAPWLAPGDAYRGALSVGLRPPSSSYLFGTDAQGRDVLSRVLFGALDYVQAARALGASDARLVSRHILPNVVAPVIIAATLGVGGAIMAEAALSFVGLGAQPPTPSWGAMVAEGRDLLRVAPWVSLFPGLAIGVAVLGLDLVGDGLGDALAGRT